MTPLVVVADGVAWAWSAVEITGGYDLSRADPARATRDQAEYLDRLLAVRAGEVVALRWVRTEPGRLRLWLLARTSAAVPETAASRAVTLAGQLAAVPPHLVAEPVADPAAVQGVLTPFVPAPDGLAQVGKRVRAQPPERPDAGVEEYLAVEPFARNGVDWSMLLDLLAACPYPLALTVTLAPERVSAQVRRTVEAEAARFARLAEPHDDAAARVRLPPDSAAAALAELFQDAALRYRDHAFRYGMTVASPVTLDEMVVEALGRTVAAGQYATARPGRPAEYEALAHALATLQPVELPEPAVRAGPARRGLLELRGLVDRAEAGALFGLPLAVEGHVPGFPVLAARESAPASLLVGWRDDDGAEVRVAVPERVAVAGGTALDLCRQLWADHGVPFLVLDPTGGAYRRLAALPELADLVVFTAGDETVAPLRLNPFEVPAGTPVGRHLGDLVAAFDAAYRLTEPLPLVYRRALTRMYRRHGYHPDTPGGAGPWPVLADFVAALTDAADEAGLDVATRLRAQSLVEGPAGATLDCRRSVDFAALADRPVVVELDRAGDTAGERALVTLLLRRAVRHRVVIGSGDGPGLRIRYRAPGRAAVCGGGLDGVVPVRVPEPPDLPAVTEAELRARHAALLADPGFAEAMAPYDECAPCRHRCAFRRRAESVVLADPAAAREVADLAAAGCWAEVAAALDALASGDPTEDHHLCLFIHALRSLHRSGIGQLWQQVR
ncbi:MAG: hypothetical protein E6F99_07455 [Actinobacteria bacterium]|nr:MAG: hypothetical protein E6F99_07455 [Actinomycetota bacterium]